MPPIVASFATANEPALASIPAARLRVPSSLARINSDPLPARLAAVTSVELVPSIIWSARDAVAPAPIAMALAPFALAPLPMAIAQEKRATASRPIANAPAPMALALELSRP